MEKGTSDGPWGAMRLLISTPFGYAILITRAMLPLHNELVIVLFLVIDRELQTVGHRFVLDVTLKSGKGWWHFFFYWNWGILLLFINQEKANTWHFLFYWHLGRPVSNMDPHVATSMIAETTILWKVYLQVISCLSHIYWIFACGVGSFALHVIA